MGVSCDHGAEGASRHRELVPLDDGTVDFAVREDRAVLVDGPHAAGHPMVVDRIGRVRGDFDMRPDRAGAPVSDPNRRPDGGPLGRHERRDGLQRSRFHPR